MVLWLYRAAWEPALWAVRFCAGLETMLGGNLWPAHWQPAERLDTGSTRAEAPKTIWLHAASLGECKGLWAFAHILRETSRDRASRLLLTTNTTAGLDFLRARIAEQKPDERNGGIHARLAPLDHPRVAERFLRNENVRALVLFEVELWPHWIFAARKNKIPVFWISARLTARARRRYAGNRLFAAALRRVLGSVAAIQTQTEEDAAALRALGGRDPEVGGDMRGLYYLGERAQQESRAAFPDAARRGTAFVSIHAHELPALLPKITAVDTETPIWIFPRKLKEIPFFATALAPHGFALHSVNPDAPRVIVDAFGLVAETLMQARAAVIGGSFGESDRIGGHNLWEPMLAGVNVEIGPHHANQAYLVHNLAEAENDREQFLAREAITLMKSADRACERILKVI